MSMWCITDASATLVRPTCRIRLSQLVYQVREHLFSATMQFREALFTLITCRNDTAREFSRLWKEITRANAKPNNLQTSPPPLPSGQGSNFWTNLPVFPAKKATYRNEDHRTIAASLKQRERTKSKSLRRTLSRLLTFHSLHTSN